MKRISIIFIAAVASVLVSCSKESSLKGACESKEGTRYNYVFNGGQLSGDSPAEDDEVTKMTINSYSSLTTTLKWESGDAINIVNVADGSSTGTATIASGTGTGFGTFNASLSAAPGTVVRVLYPSTATYGGNNLPTEQDLQSQSAGLLKYTHAYSEEIELVENEAIDFSLKHALAFVRIRFIADKDEFADWNGSGKQGTVRYISVRTIDSPLSGDYTVDYHTGAIIPGANTKDYVNLHREGGFNTSSPNTAHLVTFPTGGEKLIEVKVTIKAAADMGGATTVIPVLFKGEIKAGKINVFDLGSISTKTDYLSTGNDYYAKWLSGQDIVIGDRVINKTNFPQAEVLKASEFTRSKFEYGGLFFIDEKTATSAITTEITSNQIQVAQNAETAVIGRWKDAGTMPTVQIAEMRVNNYDLSFLNMKIVPMRTNSGNVFGKQNAAANDTKLRLKDCYVDARNVQFVADLLPSGTTTYKTYTLFHMENCAVDMPVRRGGGAVSGTSSLITCGKGSCESASASQVIVRDCALFTSENTAFSANSVYLAYFNGKTYGNTSLSFENNTIANFQNNNGMCYFTNSTIKSFVFEHNLIYIGGSAADANETGVTRNQTSTFTDVSIDYNFAATSSTSRAARVNHATYPFSTGYGSNNIDTSKSTKYKGIDVFEGADYSRGYFPINTAIVTNGAGATVKDFFNQAL